MKNEDKRKIMDKDIPSLRAEIHTLRMDLTHDILKMGTNKPKDVTIIPKKRKKLAIMLTALVRNISIKNI